MTYLYGPNGERVLDKILVGNRDIKRIFPLKGIDGRMKYAVINPNGEISINYNLRGKSFKVPVSEVQVFAESELRKRIIKTDVGVRLRDEEIEEMLADEISAIISDNPKFRNANGFVSYGDEVERLYPVDANGEKDYFPAFDRETISFSLCRYKPRISSISVQNAKSPIVTSFGQFKNFTVLR